jgi:hypothetical protein
MGIEPNSGGYGDGGGSGRYLLFVWTPAGYRLEEREGQPPAPGSEVDLGDRRQRVTKIGPSPLPGDPRPCAYLMG